MIATAPTDTEPRALLSRLQEGGVVLTARDGALTYDAPAGVLTDEDRTALRAYKTDLIALLTADRAPAATVTTGKKDRPTGPPAATTEVQPPPPPLRRRSAPREQFSHEQIPTQPCAACGGRAWRLRETPKSAGGWLWVCARCADAAGQVSQAPNAPQGQVPATGAATSPYAASPDRAWDDEVAHRALAVFYADVVDDASAWSARHNTPWPAFEDDGPLAQAIDVACEARDWPGLLSAIAASLAAYRARLVAGETTVTRQDARLQRRPPLEPVAQHSLFYEG